MLLPLGRSSKPSAKLLVTKKETDGQLGNLQARASEAADRTGRHCQIRSQRPRDPSRLLLLTAYPSWATSFGLDLRQSRTDTFRAFALTRRPFFFLWISTCPLSWQESLLRLGGFGHRGSLGPGGYRPPSYSVANQATISTARSQQDGRHILHLMAALGGDDLRKLTSC